MLTVGVVLLVVGFVLVLPRDGGVPGSEAIRHVDVGMGTLYSSTAGRADRPEKLRTRPWRTIVGLLALAAGVVVIVVAL